MKKVFILFSAALVYLHSVQAQVEKSPSRAEGEGPYTQLIIRGVTLIDGTGAPPIGPVDIVVKQNRITEIRTVGYPGVPVAENR
ncbi:MAG TPA: amidohydrolase, partial [Cyclobacteriaceae bacterium]|nr:amidohydrolase [Cyclobacteriaceae bacterium]